MLDLLNGISKVIGSISSIKLSETVKLIVLDKLREFVRLVKLGHPGGKQVKRDG